MKYTSIDQYHAAFPGVQSKLMEQLRNAIRQAAPDATETIGYNMPAFRQHKILAYYAAYKHHIGFYPTSAPIAAFKKELKDFKTSKGAIQFPLDKRLPTTLIKKIIKYRVQLIRDQLGLD